MLIEDLDREAPVHFGEQEVQRFRVGQGDSDDPGVEGTDQTDTARLSGQAQIRDGVDDFLTNSLVRQLTGERGMLLDGVIQFQLPQERAAKLSPVIEHCRQCHQRKQAADAHLARSVQPRQPELASSAGGPLAVTLSLCLTSSAR